MIIFNSSFHVMKADVVLFKMAQVKLPRCWRCGFTLGRNGNTFKTPRGN